MAQTGFTPIQLYSTSTAAAAPSASNLTNSTLGSELAINITDGKLFYKDNANAVQVIGWKTVPTTAGGTGLTTYTAGDLSYYASGTTFTKLAIGTIGQILTSTGSAPQWSTLSGVAVTTFSAGTTGFTPNSATSGAITLAGTLITSNGGTGLNSYTAGDLSYYASGTALTKLAIGAAGRFLSSTGSAPQWSAPAALTEVDDTNVTMTLGGSPSTALLSAVSMTLGWTGTLATSRGGTGLSSFTANGVVYASSTSALTTSGSFSFDGTNVLQINNASAKLRIGVTASSAYLDIYRDNATGFTIYDAAQGAPFRAHVWKLGGADAMRIHSSGGVSIGNTTDPGATNLSVNGVIKIGTKQAVNGPAFSAYPSASQSIATGTTTKISFDTELFDTNSNFNTANYRFTPTIEGYYQVNVSLAFNAVATGTFSTILQKNGSNYLVYGTANFGANYPFAAVNCVVYMNGSTDYLEVYLFQDSGSNGVTLANRSDVNQFSASMIRGA